MKHGVVNEMLEPRVPLTFVAAARRVTVEMVVDTGFEGFASLPGHIIHQLRLACEGTVRAVLADDSEVEVEYYSGTAVWNGHKRNVEVLMSDGDPLLGTGLLRGHSLGIDFAPGGKVSIRRMRAH